METFTTVGDIDAWAAADNHVHVPPPRPALQFSVRMLHRNRGEDWALHPRAMRLIAQYCQNHEEQADPAALIRNIQQSFVIDDPGLMVLVFLMDDQLIGHVLCDRSILYHKPIVTVHQYMLSHAIPNETRKEAIRLIREWAKDPGPNNDREPATYIQWLVKDKQLARMYQRFFKAKPHLLLMRMPVEE